MIYLDSSALLKLVRQERESDALDRWLSARPDTPVVSSELAKVEVIRASRQIGPHALPPARALLAGLDLIPISSEVLDGAADIGEIRLNSLDALHLASALSIRADLTTFVAFDQQLAAAASAAGLELLDLDHS